MRCIECGAQLSRLDNEHLLACSGLTLHEYALRHSMPLDLLVSPDQVNVPEDRGAYPVPRTCPGEQARSVLQGLRLAGLVQRRGDTAVIRGDIRRLDLLLWDLQYLREFGFRFLQEYRFDESSNRVVAENTLKALAGDLPQRDSALLSLVPPPDFRAALAVCIAHVGELHAGYLFLPVSERLNAEEIRVCLQRYEGIETLLLDSAESADGVMLRSLTIADTSRLFDCLKDRLQDMPGVWQRFHDKTPEVTVVKELVFDSAHFITDHPAKCSNLHGGRYKLQVKVAGRIDPASACVVDYGYLKRVVNRRVVDRFDHHNLNFVASELAWRSSTEMLCVYIWEQLIDYLPGLIELQLYETEQSWCHYRGPSLAEFQQQGSDRLMHHFTGLVGHQSELRAQLAGGGRRAFSVVA